MRRRPRREAWLYPIEIAPCKRGGTEARSSFAQQALNILRLVEVLGGLEPIGATSLADTRSAARKSVPAIVTARCVLAPAGGYRGRAVMPLTTHNITGLSQRTGEGHRPVAVVSRVALLNA
jgi:hypothetical protein